jgi:hypothetical protein
MKQKLILTLLTLGLGLSARAATIFTDNFNEYADGVLPVQPGTPSATWTNHSGTGSLPISAGTLYVGQTFSSDVSTFLGGQPYAPNSASPSATNVFYYSFTVNFQLLPTASGGFYFAHLKDNGTANFRARLFAFTNTAAPGTFRLGIANGAGTASATNSADLSPGTTYTIVVRYYNPTNTFSAPISTLWINPTSETDPSFTATDATTPISVTTMSFRQPGSTTTPTAGAATMAVDNLVVATTFQDVVPASVNAPTILVQPGDTNVFASSTVVFGTFAAGDAPIGYQWYYNTTTVLTDSSTNIGSTSKIRTLLNVTVGQSGTYSCVVSNTAGTNTTRYAVLTASPAPIPPTITNEPAGSTNIVGDTVTLTVVAGGLPLPSYQWKVVTNGVTNNVAGANITGTNSATLTFTGITLAEAGNYFVRLTNSAGATNSSIATIGVLPPPVVTIADFRSRVDAGYTPTNTTAIFTVSGIVTSWTNMTTSKTSTEFYMQDGSGGIAVFWSGADPSTNLPPAGSLVSVTGPAASFSALLEIEPVFTNSQHNLTVISTNNPLPAPQPLPFDPNVVGNLALMKPMESMYFVASNVTLTAGPSFISSANEPIFNNALHVKTFSDSVMTLSYTNDVGQSFTFFVNGATDIPNQPKPTGPVTILGIMGYFSNATFQGFEFTPSRLADIITYTHQTNVLSNLTRFGDAPTNTFTESVLRPGESLSMIATIGDPEGGTVTLTPFTDGLSANAHWSNLTTGPNASAQFDFTPTANDAGTNYVIALGSSSTSGVLNTNFWYIYVPTAQEQQVYISEFLANTTTNVNAPNFNPLHRAFDTNSSLLGNDQFVEIANQSGTDLDLFGWSITDASTRRHTFVIGAPVEQLAVSSSNAVVVYGGPKTGDTSPPRLPVPSFPANASGNLGIPFSGAGVIELRSSGYYNSGLGTQPGYIVDRIVYGANDSSTNGSLARFPGPNGKLRFVPQGFVNTNATTAGLQYDGSTWLVPTQTPHSVTNVTVVPGNPVQLNFAATPSLMSTLWEATDLTSTFQPVAGQQFGTTSGVFSITNPPPSQFYYITTQTNY